MAECSYARCLQERRLIKRELLKWSKDMLHIVGLERVAEELMGRRKWKHYHETLTRTTNLNTDQLSTSNSDQPKAEPHEQPELHTNSVITDSVEKFPTTPQVHEENHRVHNVDHDGKIDHLKVHHRISDDIDPTDPTTEAAPKTPRVVIKVTTSNLEKLLTEATAKDQHNSNATSHNHTNNKIYNNNNNTGTTKTTKLENNNITKTTEQNIITADSHHSELLANLGLRRAGTPYLEPEAVEITTTSPGPAEVAAETEAEVEVESTPATPPPPEPIDWKPNEKCYFCVDGKLLTVNAKGELVAESGPALTDPADHAHRQLIDTESESNDSCTPEVITAPRTTTRPSSTGATNATTTGVNVSKLLASRLIDSSPNMTSMDSMVARLAAIQSFSGQFYPNFNWLQTQQPNSVTPTTSDTSAAAVSPALKDSPSPSDATGEQPLDLSSKPSPNSSISGDLKLSTRSNTSRSTPIPAAAARRTTYSDDDLSNALQDIISGKLGTRKAAVQYNIPRSTLRNKVHKLSQDAKRANAPAPVELLQHLQHELELDKDALSGDDDADSSASTPQPDDLASRIAASATLRKLCENHSSAEEAAAQHNTSQSPRASGTSATNVAAARKALTPHPQTSPSTQSPLAPIRIDPNLLVQALLLTATGFANPGAAAALPTNLDESVTLRDLFGAILMNSGLSLKDETATDGAASDALLNNGNSAKPSLMHEQRLLLQQLQQQQQQLHQPPAAQYTHHRLPKAETPETASPLDLHELQSDDPSVILKIPSYKPVAGSSTSIDADASTTVLSTTAQQHGGSHTNASAHRNGDSPHSQTAPSPRISNVLSLRQSNDSESPPAFSLRDVIANSIHRTMNEQANKEAHAAAAASMLGLGSGCNSETERNASGEYKKPSISVVKNIGGTDTSCFGTAPNLLASGQNSHHNPQHPQHQQHQQHPQQHHHQHPHHQHLHHAHHASSAAAAAHHLSRQEAAALAAGKGTRPKRGKYRNYDRDSLVEAVRAVQRGEMSVHRAGSYYGVPHSTLEYKVKERHLMRPRKREPKPQPLDAGSSGAAAASTSKTNVNSNVSMTAVNSLDKLKPNTAASKLGGALKNSSSQAAQPNGLKMPLFDPSVTAAQLQYPHLFWPNPAAAAAFAPMQLDFNRNTAPGSNAATTSTGAAGGLTSPYVSADILKSHIQRYQEESLRNAGSSAGGAALKSSPSRLASPMSAQNSHARELAESLDGIIRNTLGRKSGEVAPPPHRGALLDQLLVKKTPLPFTNNRSGSLNDYTLSSATPLKRAGSPLTSPSFPGVDIKRERSSPLHNAADIDDGDASNSEVDEHNNSSHQHSQQQQHQQHLLQRSHSRMTSRDSDTDGSAGGSLKSSAHFNNSSIINTNNMCSELNGNEAADGCESSSVRTSILQQKLDQIKAERDCDENL